MARRWREGARAAPGSALPALPPVKRALAVIAALVILLASPANAVRPPANSISTPAARRLLQYPFPKDAFDRTPLYGAAKGARAWGQPDPVQGLTTPDQPELGPKSASMEDLVLSRGYPLETYPVETSDGYVLRLYRIPHGVKNATGTGPKPVVLLHHGVTLASSSFVVLDPSSSQGFYLADAGFDVWMVNTRGNTYSKGQRYYRQTEPEYWQFSIDELALIDLPTQIDYILSKTGQKTLSIVGHSQGCTLPLMLLAAKPEYNDKIWLTLHLGPVVHAQYVKSPFLRKQAETASPAVLINAGVGKFIPNSVTSQMTTGCKEGDESLQYCADLINFMFYGNSKLTSPDDTLLIATTWPSTVSMRNLYHWSQMYHARRGLQMFDFGTNCGAKEGGPSAYFESCNQAKYGQDEPPTYDLSHVTSRAAIFRGEIDVMATTEDINALLSEWKANVVSDITFPSTAHMDFVWARAPTSKPDIIRVLWDNAPRP